MVDQTVIYAAVGLLVALVGAPLFASDAPLNLDAVAPPPPETVAEVVERMKPYTGPHVSGVDTTTLTGKVMCGYQGWFAAEGDGAERSWFHYGAGHKRFHPGSCTIDYWPDMSEFDEDEKFVTPFKYADGSTAHVFSPYRKKTVVRHFKWMKEAGIDGVFLQRFATNLRAAVSYNHRNVVTSNVQAGANLHGRTWAMMYDITSLKPGEIKTLLIPDFKNLVDRMKIHEDKAYLHHEGKPVISIWGVGLKTTSTKQRVALDECEELIQFLKHDPVYGGNCVMLGTAAFFREQVRDANPSPRLHEVLTQADILSGWAVTRFQNKKDAERYARETIAGDVPWGKERGIDVMPVAYPGFSWYNQKVARGEEAELGRIPRHKGEFLWTQLHEYTKAGAEMIYVAMFDEIDEGTAIFKCTNNPPVGESPFLTYDGLPTDHYLWITGLAGALLRGDIENTPNLPSRAEAPAPGD